ncbi:MAG TPA: hypothetical protein VFE03_16570 [Caulobacteraceae bacterium]|jgi:hypothetical protein|nr:hypothetical protein [Caulobacteraceae bacterium]
MLASLALVACGPADPGPGVRATAHDDTQAETTYLAPPSLMQASRMASGRVVMTGRAQPGAHVRLATPAGVAVTAAADASGAWRIALPPASDLRLFGLSMSQGERTVQSEGYLAVTPDGHAAQLRSGAAALVLGAPAGALRILAVDYDRKGGAVISGAAGAGDTVGIAIDGIQRQATADADGRFILSLNEPLATGVHQVEAVEGPARVRADVPVSPAAPLTPGPFRAERTGFGWRIDWMTPGGGVQTTLILEPSESPA